MLSTSLQHPELTLGSGIVLRERAAILKVLASVSPRLAGATAFQKAAISQWLAFATSTAAAATATGASAGAGAGAAAAALATLDEALSSRSYLTGPAATAADAAVWYAIAPALVSNSIRSRSCHPARIARLALSLGSVHTCAGSLVLSPRRDLMHSSFSCALAHFLQLCLQAAVAETTRPQKYPALCRWVAQMQSGADLPLTTTPGAPAAVKVPPPAPLRLFATKPGGSKPSKAAPSGGAAAAPDSAAAPAATPAQAPAAPGAAAAAAAGAKPGKQGKEKPAPAAAAAAAAAPAAGAAAAATGKPAKATGGAAAAPAPAAAAGGEEDLIAQCDFRVGLIVEAWKHPEKDRLYCERIDVGEASGPRTIASGLVEHYPLDAMQKRRVVIVANLKPRPMGDFVSNGMVLCATSPAGKVEFVEPPAGAAVGERVTFPGHEGAAADPNKMAKKKIFDLVAPHLVVDDNLRATYKGIPFTTSAGPCTVVSAKGGTIH